MRSAARAEGRASGSASSSTTSSSGWPASSENGTARPGGTTTSAGCEALKDALELTWRDDRYLRAIHDDGTEIGVEGSGVWEIDALTAAWAVMSGINPGAGRIVFETALEILEKETTILLGWPPLREDTKPYLGRSSGYPEGVRENGMYCHGVQWLVGAAQDPGRAVPTARARPEEARQYVETAYRLWLKISPIPHVGAGRDRDLRRPAEQAGGRHGDDVRPRPDDLERLHRGGGLDVPPGPRGRAGPAPRRRRDRRPDRPGAAGGTRLVPRRPRPLAQPAAGPRDRGERIAGDRDRADDRPADDAEPYARTISR